MSINTGKVKQIRFIVGWDTYYVAIKINEVYSCVDQKKCPLYNNKFKMKLQKSILNYAHVYYLLWT